MRNSISLGLASICVFLFAGLIGCTVGPDYEPPQVDAPESFRGASQGRPTPGRWWESFGDVTLNKLITQATQVSPDIDRALARLDQAQARAGGERAELLPEIGYFVDAVRDRRGGAESQTLRAGGSVLSWELDAWGRLRRLDRAAQRDLEAAAAALQGAVLLLQTSVADTYFALRGLDASIAVLSSTVDGREERRQLIELRAETGLANDLEAAQARTEWATALASLESLRRQRVLTENALSALLSAPTEQRFFPADQSWEVRQPSLPSGLPSELLLRRPDLREAERLLAASSELVGARLAEFFPRLTLRGEAGGSASQIADWFRSAGLLGLIESNLAGPLFDGGRISSRVQEARAVFRELSASYLAQVQTAFREVEDGLAEVEFFQKELRAQEIAAEAANRAASLARDRFDSGLVNFLEVVDTERTALETSLRLVEVRASLNRARVSLIRSLGGGPTR
ncbi:MAG: efflux transporter outer membrane subunit [Verrucomicrobiales bacterium]